MAAINPYLNFNGTTEEAFNFYKSVFGGEFLTVMYFKDIPKEYQSPKDDGATIMHIALPIGQGSVLMGSDFPEAMGKLMPGNNVHVAIAATSEKEADKLFTGLSAGGKVMMPMSKSFWNSYFGMFMDKFGIHWMINFDYEQK